MNLKKTIKLNKKILLTVIPCVIFGGSMLGVSGYFLHESIDYNSHVIGKSNKEVFGQKEDNYVILEYTGSVTAKSMVRELRRLSEVSDLGWYILDYSNYTTDELTKLGIDYDPQYRFVTTKTKDDGTKEKELLYSSYGLKTAENLDKEFHFVEDYGLPDTSDVSKTGDNVSIYFTDLDYDEGDSVVKLNLELMTTDKTPMTFDVKNLSVVDLDTGETDGDYVITTSVESGRVSYDPYDVDDDATDANTTPAELPITITIPKDKRDSIRGLKLVYFIASENNEEKNDTALKYTTESGTSISESTSFKLPTPQMSIDSDGQKIEISTETDNGTYVAKNSDYYYYNYYGEYAKTNDESDENVQTTDLRITIKNDTTLTVNDSYDISYTLTDNKLDFTYGSETYSFTLDKENKALTNGTIKGEDYEIDNVELKAKAIKSLSTVENGESKTYSLDLLSDNFTYYYKFKESDDWSTYDPEVGIKAEDLTNNRLYVRSEYKYEDTNGEITIYSMVGQYIKPYTEDINVTFKIRLN